MVLAADELAVADGLEVAEAGRQPRRDDALDELVVAAAVGDEVGDGDHLQVVALAVLDEVADARHRAVVVHDLADDAGGVQAGEPREVDRGLGLADALEHAAGAALQREDVAGLDEVARRGLGVDRDLDRARAVVRRDARRDAFARLDRDRERRLERRLVLRGHEVEAELVAALRGEAEADEPAAVRGHEVHGLGGRELRGHREIALVLAILVVADDDHLARADVLERLVDRRERAVLRGAHARQLRKPGHRAG